jgi:hypothetical protein
VDFAIESHMDRVAHEIGMDPVELRILNAYRDGDMKAHRREAKNCALIECCQVAAEKAGWPIRSEFMAMSSLRGGGGERALIPATVTDEEGRIGERRGGRSPIRRPEAPAPSRPAAPPPSRPMAPPPMPPAAPAYAHPAAAPLYAPPPAPPAPPPPAAAAEPPAGRPPHRPGYSRFASNLGSRRR